MTTATSSSTLPMVWKTPIPYLFGGLAAVIILIATALIMLACSFRKHAGESNDEKPSAKSLALKPLDEEPRIVVIMAGDDVPSYIARPMPKPELKQDHCCDDYV